MTRTPSSPDLTRLTLSVLVLGLLVVTCLWILQPFLGAIVWASMIVVATWPTMLALQARLGGRRWLAIAIMTLGMLFVLVLPLALAVSAIVEHLGVVSGWVTTAMSGPVPGPPDWLHQIPLVGRKIAGEWQRLAARNPDELASEAAPYAVALANWFAGKIGGLGMLALQFLLTVLITVMFYASGEEAATGVRRFARRLAGDRGDQAVLLAGQAIRAVAISIVVTAFVQSLIAGVGLAVIGIPYAAVLTSIMFMLCIVQVGPFLVMVPAVGWLFWSGHPMAAVVLLVWTLVVGAIDNILRPVLIKRGADLPLPLIFAGAIGGLISLGFIGVFVGPVILAVTYRLLEWWIGEIDAPPAGS